VKGRPVTEKQADPFVEPQGQAAESDDAQAEGRDRERDDGGDRLHAGFAFTPCTIRET
jgi:hypothetical protein